MSDYEHSRSRTRGAGSVTGIATFADGGTEYIAIGRDRNRRRCSGQIARSGDRSWNGSPRPSPAVLASCLRIAFRDPVFARPRPTRDIEEYMAHTDEERRGFGGPWDDASVRAFLESAEAAAARTLVATRRPGEPPGMHDAAEPWRARSCARRASAQGSHTVCPSMSRRWRAPSCHARMVETQALGVAVTRYRYRCRAGRHAVCQ